MIKNKTKLNPTDLSYAAGLIEGEGSLYLSKYRVKNSKTNRLRFECGITIKMNDREPVEFLAKLFGGNVFIGSKKVNLKTKQHYSPAYCVSFRSADQIERVIKSVMPYLKFKNAQAKVLLEFISLKQSFKNLTAPNKFLQLGRLNNLYTKSKNLKQKGWIISK